MSAPSPASSPSPGPASTAALPWDGGPIGPWIGGGFRPAETGTAGAGDAADASERTAAGGLLADHSPSTGELLAEVRLATRAEVGEAVELAKAAQREWARRPIRERADVLDRVADALLAAAETIGRIDTRDTGSPLAAMTAGARKGALYLKQLCGVALELQGRTVPASASGWHVTRPEPFGVIGAITAYNHPTLYFCLKAGPALLAGNALVLKPSEQAPLSSLFVASLTRDLLPPGLLAVLPARADASEALVTHRDVPRISFTGSIGAAVAIQAAIARAGRIKSVALELGGKNPIVVFDDADLDAAAAAVVRGMNYTRVQGQSCGSTSRLLAHASLAPALAERVVERVAAIRVGLPEDPATEMGCLISHAHRDRVLGFVSRAEADGAEVLTGGRVPDAPELAAGAFLEPTVIGSVAPGSELAAEEVYGPVLAVMTWADEAEAIALANATEYGLTASVWTRDLSRALRTVDALEAGYVWVNDVETRYPGVPFGGWKQSGVGTEQSLLDDLRQCTRTKAVNIAV